MTGVAIAAVTVFGDVQTWWERWIWPAGGSGGTPGDVVGTLIWVVIAALVVRLLWNPVKRGIHGHIDCEFAYLHRKLDAHADLLEHIIKHHPDIPDPHIDVPRGVPDHATLRAAARASSAAAKAAAATTAVTSDATSGAPTGGTPETTGAGSTAAQ